MIMKRYKFTAEIQEGMGGGAHVFFPYDVEKEFGTKGRVPVKATFNGVPYSGSLYKYGHPQHMLGILKGIREQIGASIGDEVNVEIWKDDSVRKVDAPSDFKQAMSDAKVLEFFESLSYTHQREYTRWVTEAKREETKRRRMEQAIQMLKDKVKTPDH